MQTPDQLLCNRGIINQSLIKTRQWIQHPPKEIWEITYSGVVNPSYEWG